MQNTKFEVGDKVKVTVSLEDSCYAITHGEGTQGIICKIYFEEDYPVYALEIGDLTQLHLHSELVKD